MPTPDHDLTTAQKAEIAFLSARFRHLIGKDKLSLESIVKNYSECTISVFNRITDLVPLMHLDTHRINCVLMTVAVATHRNVVELLSAVYPHESGTFCSYICFHRSDYDIDGYIYPTISWHTAAVSLGTKVYQGPCQSSFGHYLESIITIVEDGQDYLLVETEFCDIASRMSDLTVYLDFRRSDRVLFPNL